ncbi:MAG: hypothetical protein JWR58_6949, partial [Pseudonocardia sp.]|nr:hypothetical protein [Pseudonocardia sp.]
MPANCPTDSGDWMLSSCSSTSSTSSTSSSARAIRCGASGRGDGVTCGDGQLGSPAQRPGRSSYAVEGGTLSCIQMR